MLVIACPCALGLATPTAMGKCASQGVFIEGDNDLESSNKVFDFNLFESFVLFVCLDY